MRKSILAVLLAVALVAPAFAASTAKKAVKQETKKESKFDIVGKLGVLVAPSFDSPYDNPSLCYNRYAGNADSTFAIALEGYYKLDEKLSVGLGISYGFESKLSANGDVNAFYDDGKAKLGFTNIYLSVKPNLSESIYAIGQIGYGISHGSFYDSYNGYYTPEQTFKVDGGGVYFGLGAGVEYKSFLFEVLYSINTATFKEKYCYSAGTEEIFTYSAFNVNVGYKFSI